jgi:DNA-binding MarR family transcriptional regulator
MRLSYLIGSADRMVKRRLTEVLAPYGLTLPQFTALSVLDARGPLSNAQLAERSLITPQSANEVVKVMEAGGWVARESDPTHGRIIRLQLTQSGRQLMRRCDEAVTRVEQQMLHSVEGQHAALLHSLLQTCVRNLRTT